MSLNDKPDPAWAWDGVVANQSETEFFWVIPMAYNWRIITVPKSDQSYYGRFWCYVGRGQIPFVNAVAAAMVWDGVGEPIGWNKNGQTGEFREDTITECLEVVIGLTAEQQLTIAGMLRQNLVWA